MQIQERKIVEIVITRPDLIKPEGFEYKTPGSNAFDLKAAIEEPVTVSNTGGSVLIPAGFKMRILDSDYAGVILPRSGMGHKEGIVLGNGTGLIDNDYRGEVMVSVLLRKQGATRVIQPGERIAQMCLVKLPKAQFKFVDEFSEDSTERGEGGFGSTGSH